MPKPLICLLALTPLVAAINTTVHVEGGQLAGVSLNNVTIFKGVPFAAPPVVDLRWRAPQPPLPWQGIRQARDFGANCSPFPVPGRV